MAVIFPQHSTESLLRPTSVPLLCITRNDEEILLAIKVLCLLTASLHLCCACLQAADVSILRNSGHLALLSRASIYLEHSTVTQSAQAGDTGAHMDIIHAKC